MLWTHAQTVGPAVGIGQPSSISNVPCTFDFNVAATKYFDGLETGEVSSELQFSGTVFYRDWSGLLQVMQIS